MANRDDRLSEEIQFHIEQQTARNIAGGMGAEEARRRALLKFGGVESARESARDEIRGAWFGDFLRDMRVGFRTLRRAPSFALTTVLTFALGLGAAAAMFTVVNGILLKPLPYPQADRIVRLFQIGTAGRQNNVSGPNFADWRDNTHSFVDLTVMMNRGRSPVVGLGEPQMLQMYAVSKPFFEAMGVQPALGRAFAADEFKVDGPKTAIVSAALWDRIGTPGAPAGQHFSMYGETFNVIGVMPRSFDYPVGTAIWLPLDESGLAPTASRTGHNYQAIARLNDHVSLGAAQADISALSRRLKTKYGDETWMIDATAMPILDVLTLGSRQALQWLLIASLLLLVVASTNVSNMLVAHSASRKREFAVQLAIGATPGRITRQLLAETMALCLCGATLGLGIAIGVIRVFAAFGPAGAPRLSDVSVDWSTVGAAAAAAIVVSSVLAIVTAISGRSARIADALAENSRSGSSSRRQMRLREMLIVTQVAVTLVLLAGAGLVARSFAAVLAVDPGYRTDDTLIADLTMSFRFSPEEVAKRVSRQQDIVAAVRAVPGVTNVGFINAFPISKNTFFSNGQYVEMTRADEFTSFDQMQALGAAIKPRLGQAEYRIANGDYFKAMGIPLLKGRLIDDGDGPGAAEVAVISKSFADKRWPHQDPLGRFIQFGNMDGDLHGIRIVGVVGDVREVTPEAVPGPMLYASYLQRPRQAASCSLVVRGVDPHASADAVRRAIRAVDPEVAVDLRTFVGAFDLATGNRRFSFWLVAVFAMAALAIATLGLYGLIAFMVSQRTREMGIRMALGAEPGSLVYLIVKRGLWLAALGAGAGVLAALWLSGAMKSLLYGVQPTDPLVLAGVVLVMITAAIAASYVPARRILRQTPAMTLRDI